MMKTVQLRSYRLRDGEYDAFIAWWTSEMAPLRRAAGFRIEFAYGIPETNEFIWAVSVEGSASHFAEVESLYLASDERAAVMGEIPARVADRSVQLVTTIDGTGQ